MKNIRTRFTFVVLALMFLLGCGTSNRLIEKAFKKTQTAVPTNIVLPTEATVPTQKPLPTYTPYPTLTPPSETILPTEATVPNKPEPQKPQDKRVYFIGETAITFDSVEFFKGSVMVGDTNMIPYPGTVVMLVSGHYEGDFQKLSDSIVGDTTLFVADKNVITYYNWDNCIWNDTEFTFVFYVDPDKGPFYLFYSLGNSWSVNLSDLSATKTPSTPSYELMTPVDINGVEVIFESIGAYDFPVSLGDYLVTPERGEIVVFVYGRTEVGKSFETVVKAIQEDNVLFIIDDDINFSEWKFYEYRDYTKFTIAFTVTPNKGPYTLYYGGATPWSINLGDIVN